MTTQYDIAAGANRADGELLSEHAASFLGSFRISIQSLAFGNRADLDGKRVALLAEKFRIAGCYRLLPEHHIAGILSEVEFSSVKKTETEPYLSLEMPPNILKLKSELNNQRNDASGGEIYRNMRLLDLAGNKLEASKWRATLTATGRQNVQQLLKVEEYKTKFDGLLQYRGLWFRIPIGMFHRLVVIKCKEEAIAYLTVVETFWHNIVEGHDPEILDGNTVLQLQLLVPSLPLEREAISQLFQKKKVFPTITDSTVRAELCRRILRFSRQIPSLYTFFEDLKYLETGAIGIKQLFSRDLRYHSMRELLSVHFDPVLYKQGFIDCLSDTTVKLTGEPGFHLAYLQLWIYALRQFHELTTTKPLKDPTLKAHPLANDSRHETWAQYDFAILASNLGFRSPEIARILGTPPQDIELENLLHSALPRADQHSVGFQKGKMLLKSAYEEALKAILSEPKAVSSHIAENIVEPLNHRCGRPYSSSHIYSIGTMYLNNLLLDQPSTAKLSPMDVNRTIFWRYFGDIRSDVAGAGNFDAMRSDVAGASNVNDPGVAGARNFEDIVRSYCFEAGSMGFPSETCSPLTQRERGNIVTDGESSASEYSQPGLESGRQTALGDWNSVEPSPRNFSHSQGFPAEEHDQPSLSYQIQYDENTISGVLSVPLTRLAALFREESKRARQKGASVVIRDCADGQYFPQLTPSNYDYWISHFKISSQIVFVYFRY
ncbi:hypothetical protein TWF281_002153 [Arthrobotrys megalospora]